MKILRAAPLLIPFSIGIAQGVEVGFSRFPVNVPFCGG